MAATEYIYYAKFKGDEEWQETIVRETREKLSEREQKMFEEELEALGMEFVRIFEFKWEAPNFAGTVNI